MPITQTASNAQLGWGTGLFRGNLASLSAGGFTQVAEVTRCGSPVQERERVERTHLASPGAKREYRAGLGDLGNMDAECNFRPDEASQDFTTGIIADYNGSVERWWQVLYTQFTLEYTLQFTAYVSSYGSVEATPEGLLKMPFALQMLSDPTWS